MTTPEQFDPIPAMKTLGGLSECLPIIIADTREQRVLPCRRLKIVRATLPTADYSVNGLGGLILIEKKSLDDLCTSITKERDRFERELERLKAARFRRLLITCHSSEVTTGRFRSSISPKAIISTLRSYECRFDLPFIFGGSEETCAEILESWCWWFSRTVVEESNSLWRACRDHGLPPKLTASATEETPA